jgi:pyridoxine 5-phosphate synthase
MAGLAVKIDPVAALRSTRNNHSPDPVAAATMAELAGADGITVHLRMDRKHINDRDVRILRNVVQTKLILEMASTSEMVGVALDIKPDLVTLVPEKSEDFSTDGGLDLIVNRADISDTVGTLQNSGIPVGLMVDAKPEQIKLAHEIGASLVEINTAIYCGAKTAQKRHQAFLNVVDAVKIAHKLKFSVKAGCGLCYKTVKVFKNIDEIDEFSIGHSIISRAVLIGMQAAVADMRMLIMSL